VALFSYLIQVMTFDYLIIMAAGLFSGLASVFFQVAAAPFFMRNSTPRERPYLFSLNFAASLVAGVLGSVVGGFLPGMIEKFGLVPYLAYRYTLFVFGGLVLAALAPYVMIRDTDEARDDDKFFNLVTSRSVIAKLFLPNLATGLGAGLSIPFINLYFKNVLHMPTRSIGVYYGLSQVLMISGVLLAPVFAEKIGKIRTVVFSQLVSIPFLVWLGITRSPVVAVVCFLIRAALMNMAQPLFTNYAMEKVKHGEQALTNALLVVAWTAGRGLSASVGGLLIVRFSYAVPFIATSFLYLASSALMYAFFKDQR
jgi:predicted MFS family arabinose efflux permease